VAISDGTSCQVNICLRTGSNVPSWRAVRGFASWRLADSCLGIIDTVTLSVRGNLAGALSPSPAFDRIDGNFAEVLDCPRLRFLRLVLCELGYALVHPLSNTTDELSSGVSPSGTAST
jgi:hypothetical protein